MGDTSGINSASDKNTPYISYDEGVSTIRISSKDLPSKAKRTDINHVIKSSTIPAAPSEGEEKTFGKSDPLIYDGPVSGSVRVSTLDRPARITRPSTFQQPHFNSSTSSIEVKPTGVTSASLESIPPGAQLPPNNPPAPPPPPLTSALHKTVEPNDAEQFKDLNGNVSKEPKDKAISLLPVLTEEDNTEEPAATTPHLREAPKKEPGSGPPAPSALRRSSGDFTSKTRNRKVSWNEEVVVTSEDTNAIYTSDLQPEDHEYTPCDGGKGPSSRVGTANGDIGTGLDGQEEALKDFGFLDEPMFSYEDSNRGPKVIILTLFILLICATLVAVVMGVLYGISITTKWDDQISSLRNRLSLEEPVNGAPFPTSWTQTSHMTSFYLVLGGESMPSQSPSAQAVLSWIKGQALQVTISDQMGSVYRVYLGNPLEKESYVLTLLMNTTLRYEAELDTDDHYCLVSIIPVSDQTLSWTT